MGHCTHPHQREMGRRSDADRTTKSDDPFVTEAARPSSMRLLHLGREREVAELEASAVAHRLNRKDQAMPLVNVKVMENVLTDQQKAQIADRITETFATVVGEPVRPVTWVVIEDIRSGQLSIGGQAVTTEGVREMLGELART